MSYLDRLRIMTFTSPSGAQFTLGFDDVIRDGGKKLAVTELPQQDRVEAQDLGNLGQRFSVTVYINGADYDQTADDFWKALSERYPDDKPGILGHPRWGNLSVKPLTFTQSEGFVEGMGEAVFAVEFVQVDTVAKFPTLTADEAAALASAADAANDAANETYGANGAPTNPAEMARASSQASNIFTATGNALRGMASSADALSQGFEQGLTTALNTVDDLLADPVALAESITTLMRAPAVAVLGIGAKVTAYSGLMDNLIAGVVGSYAEAELMFCGMAGASIGATDSTLIGDLGNRNDAVAASDGMDEFLNMLRAGIASAMEQVPGWSPDGDTLSQLEDMLSRARSRLLSSAFDLKSERRKLNPHAADPLTLVKDLYGVFSDELLTQFIKDNDLQDDEFFMVPAGREVIWYA